MGELAGKGHDRMFYQKATSCSGLDSLSVVMFLPQQNDRGKTCRFCLNTDHSDEECVVARIARKPGSSHLCRAMANCLVRTPTHERAGLVGLAEVCAPHGMRTDAHTTTAAFTTSASGAMGTIR